MSALRFVRGHWWVSWIYRDRIETWFYDGSSTVGIPPNTEAFLQSARDLGYGDDIYWHMVEHDLCHNILAEWLDTGPSAALWNQAHDERAHVKRMPACVKRDEDRVAAAQAALNGNEWGFERIVPFTNSHYPPHALVSRLAAQVRPDFTSHTSEWAANAAAPIILPTGWNDVAIA